MTTAILLILAAAAALAIWARARLWYYDRRGDKQYRERCQLEMVRDLLRAECSDQWWEGQR